MLNSVSSRIVVVQDLSSASTMLCKVFLISMFLFTVTAAMGYSSHRLDYVSESYGGAKSKVNAAASEEEKEESQDLWDIVKNETLTVVNTQRVKAILDSSDDNDADDMKGVFTMKEYKSQREMIEHRRRQGSVLRYRSSRQFSTV